MTVSRSEDGGQVCELIHDPFWFIDRLTIQDNNDELVQFGTIGMRPEQRKIVESLLDNNRVLILKPRQIGASTIVMAFVFWLMFTANRPITAISVTHEQGAQQRMNGMLRTFWQNLPEMLRPSLVVDNQQHLRWGHNGAQAFQMVAGGRGQGRSYTFSFAHFSEMGFYPRGSAAVKTSEPADKTAYGSVMSTLHGRGRVVIESTADGPAGHFHTMVQIAMRPDSGWSFIFFAWFEFKEYAVRDEDMHPGFELREDELEYLEPVCDDNGAVIRPVLTPNQIAWRRRKIEGDGYGLELFRREYPEFWYEPFLTRGSFWFDQEALAKQMRQIPMDRVNKPPELMVYHDREPGRQYFVGMDCAGGSGKDGDYAVIVVVRDDKTVCAVWRSQFKKPTQQALEAHRLSSRYGAARVLVEANSHGQTVIRRLTELGAPLWKKNGKDFWSQRGRSDTKYMVYDYAAVECVNTGRCVINDPIIATELCTIKEKANGRIEAEGDGHDDHADAFVLALWNARGAYNTVETQERRDWRARKERKRRLGL